MPNSSAVDLAKIVISLRSNCLNDRLFARLIANSIDYGLCLNLGDCYEK